MKMFDNINTFVKDDLKAEIRENSRLSIAAACFSIYAYQELKTQLDGISELRFIFTSPTFTTEKASKAKREFFIPRADREKSLYGTEFELKLRNELTQKAIAQECAEWIRQKVKFRSNITNEQIGGFLNIESPQPFTYLPLNGFTTVDIGCERGNNAFNFVHRFEAPLTQTYIQTFNSIWNDKTKLQDVTDIVIENISAVYRENPPEFIYFITLYNIFSEFLEDISEDELPNEALGFKESVIWKKLYDFQKDAALAIINKLERYNGCILADSVGLGKTFTALAVVKYYENRNKSVLVLCPKKLESNWHTFKENYKNNPLREDRLRYDVLFHTDLSRTSGKSNGLDLARLNWGAYDLVVIDESHNFRSGGQIYGDDEKRENRYLQLLNKVIRDGVKTKVLMLSATPVNNRFGDLRNQLALAYEGDSSNIDGKLNTKRGIDEIFRRAQGAFNAWSKQPLEKRTTADLLDRLDFDFFELLDSVTIARSRKHIEKNYNTAAIGKFPTRLKPISLNPCITTLKRAINYTEIFEQLQCLTLSVYLPSNFVFPSALAKYDDQYSTDVSTNVRFTQRDREKGIHRLTGIGLLKRLESSVYSFRLTLERIKAFNEKTIRIIDRFEKSASADLFEMEDLKTQAELDADDGDSDLFTVGRKVKYELADIDCTSWRKELESDVENIDLLLAMINDITPEHDNKLNTLLAQIDEKIAHPINAGNRKIIIFTAFADTANYLYDHVSKYALEKYGMHTAIVTGEVAGRSNVPKMKTDLNTVLTCFSPISKEKSLLSPDDNFNIDILIATDCISEGQNLQDCDYLVNYDIHWNPVRIIQRFGRIDRIGSHNDKIQLVNFWPDMELDDYINLKNRVETRMRITVMTATGVGSDNIIDGGDEDLEYRKKQLERLRDEVIDIEEMNSGVSIMDLGLNEFRLDLLDYIKKHGDPNNIPSGLCAVVPASADNPAGVVFVLRNVNESVNIDRQNRLHPFYMVYITSGGDVHLNHLQPKELLDAMRVLCKGKTEPIPALCKAFNRETADGRKMGKYSKLLGDAIKSIISVKEESDFDSLFSAGGTSALENDIKGLDDFELVCFLVVKEAK